ncbi:MAG: radical SAM protein [Nitrososphaerota archaeon]|nr:radical SAM protein [Nitrososphaerota archaeon]
MNKWNIGWGTVSDCNMNCEFCYSRLKREINNDISPVFWRRFIDKNAEYISSINYGTGENTLSKDWFYLVKYIRDTYPNIRQALTTNGYVSDVINRNIENKEIFLYSIDEVDVSLDYADAQKHNKFRGQPKAYDWAINTMDFCHSNKIPLTLVMLGSAINLYEKNVQAIFEIAEQFDAIIRVNQYRPTEGINKVSEKYILAIDELLSFLHFVSTNYKVLSINDTLLSSLLTNKTIKDPSGTNSLRILPNGDVTPSTYLLTDEFIIGNIKNDLLLGTIEKNPKLQHKIKKVIPHSCEKCEHSNTCCGGVIDRRYLWHNTLEEKDPYCFFDNVAIRKKYGYKITLSDDEVHSVHDGYLPTMFFKNK